MAAAIPVRSLAGDVAGLFAVFVKGKGPPVAEIAQALDTLAEGRPAGQEPGHGGAERQGGQGGTKDLVGLVLADSSDRQPSHVSSLHQSYLR